MITVLFDGVCMKKETERSSDGIKTKMENETIMRI